MQRDGVGHGEVAGGVGVGSAADVAALDVADHQQTVSARKPASFLVGGVASCAVALEERDIRLHAGHVLRQGG